MFAVVGCLVGAVLIGCVGVGIGGALAGSGRVQTAGEVGYQPPTVASTTAPTGPIATTAPATTAPPTTPPATTAPAAPPTAPATTAPVANATTTKRVTETQAIAFTSSTVQDSSLAKGTTKVRTKGVNGVRTLVYTVLYTGGTETSRTLVSSTVTKKPVNQVVAVGTKEAKQCDPNYTPCVPIASDVDCAGGSGNGPAYVQGPVQVIGEDIYGLDTDHDGIGCE